MEEQEKRRKRTRTIVFILSLLLFLAGLGYLIFYVVTKDNNHKIYEEIQQEQEKEPEEPVLEEEPVVEEEPKVEIPIDFASLKETNDDIYAWINVEGTNIDYPIVQCVTDDLYYLQHTIEGVKGYPGAIYTEAVNSKDFSDYNTLIYGHRMTRPPVMFNNIGKFEDEEFFNTHEKITIYTETEIKNYRIYGAVVYDDRHIMHSFQWDNPASRLEFIQSLHNSTNWKTHFREGMTIDENSKLITLSTCVHGQRNKRYILVAAEVEADS